MTTFCLSVIGNYENHAIQSAKEDVTSRSHRLIKIGSIKRFREPRYQIDLDHNTTKLFMSLG
mgnify:CR=1 FL=1